MTNGFFITGSDTGVGKTFVTASLARALKENGLSIGVMKPVETGCGSDAITLKEASQTHAHIDLVNPYRFKEPLAPNIAARLNDIKIDLAGIRTTFDELAKTHDMMLVEGAGGLLCPLTDYETMADLAVLLNLPLIIVSASRTGAINHTLLTVRYADTRAMDIKGIILNQPGPSADEGMSFNYSEIKRFTGLPILGEVRYAPDGKADRDAMRQLAKKLLLG
ncbi:MAG: dethiobiotin synthase [Deltaproteobacteria bacterium]|nr:dethiobiotin synthase [Deltaproteobacteria bacterium]